MAREDIPDHGSYDIVGTIVLISNSWSPDEPSAAWFIIHALGEQFHLHGPLRGETLKTATALEKDGELARIQRDEGSDVKITPYEEG